MLNTERIQCPYCWEPVDIVVDPSVSEQEYIEDCFVCCRPITLTVVVDESGVATVAARHENE